MSKITEIDFIDLKSLRDKNIERIDILDKVSQLALMPGNEFAILKQVADYYAVTEQAIKSLVFDHKEELIDDGYKVLSAKDLISSLKEPISIERPRGKVIINGTPLAYAANGIFPKRAILRVGMLLRDSDVAKQIRTYLLDVEQIAQEVAPGVINMAVEVMNVERELKADLGEAIMNGDVIAVAEIMRNIKQFESDVSAKRIVSLTEENMSLVADNQNLMAQYEVCAEEKEDLHTKLNCMCKRTLRKDERRALCASIIEAYGLAEFNSEKEGYLSVFDTLNDEYGVNIKARKVANPRKPYIDLLTLPELMLLEMLLRKLVVTFELKEFYND